MVKPSVKRKKSEAGQAVVLVAAAISLFMLAAVGLGFDFAHMYAQRQMAQGAADAAATAGIMSILNGTNTGTTNTFGASAYDCIPSDTTTPCVYARKNGFGSTSSDTIHVNPNPGVAVTGLTSGTPNELQVTITRPVSMTLTRLAGLTSYDVKATATAAIIDVLSPIPILVLHPSLPGAFSVNGGGGTCSGTSCDISIFGGPSTSIQVNSGAACSISGNPNTCANTSGTIDLSQAGPDGTGANFNDIGGPSAYPGTLLLGSTGTYKQPVGIFLDPLATLSAPPKPITTGSFTSTGPGTTPGTGDCPSNLTSLTSLATCTIYSPGYYDQGIDVKNQYAIFRPGIYYINHKGFVLDSNSISRMATSSLYNFDPTPTTDPAHVGWTSGMLVYNNPGVDGTAVNKNKDFFSISANSGQINNHNFPDPTNCASGGNCLVGANGGVLTSAMCSTAGAAAASYYGVIFFQAHNTQGISLTHSLSGGGGLTIKGTIYLTSLVTGDGSYQTLNLQGVSGSSTTVQGEIITDTLGLGGTSGITMTLSDIPCFLVRKVALVQ